MLVPLMAAVCTVGVEEARDMPVGEALGKSTLNYALQLSKLTTDSIAYAQNTSLQLSYQLITLLRLHSEFEESSED